MILNTAELSRVLFDEPDDKRLSVIPLPEEARFRAQSGASVDLHLGRWFRTMKQANLPLLTLGECEMDSKYTKEYFVPFNKGFILHPGKFVLGMTLEWLALPGDLAGNVTGKSSLGRRGLIIETASGIQPGYAGGLTLELANVGEIPIELKPGMLICQVFLYQATSRNVTAISQFKGSRKPILGTTIRIGN
jgi:dCTP deaminase